MLRTWSMSIVPTLRRSCGFSALRRCTGPAVDDLIVAIAEVNARSRWTTRLEIRGEGPALERVLFTVGDLGLDHLVDVATTCPSGVEADVVALAAVADRPFPDTLRAAEQVGRLVATDIGWVRAECAHLAPRLVARRDPSALARALIAERDGRS